MTQSPSPILVNATVPGDTFITAHCDLLVVACDPRNLMDVCQFTQQELDVFASLENYTFHTTLVKVPVPSQAADKPKYGVILKPQAIDDMDGTISGYRNETAKQFSLETANGQAGPNGEAGMTENLVTVYQILGPTQSPWGTSKFLGELKNTLQSQPWWPYDSFEICNDDKGNPITLTTPYFDHFNNANLAAHMPWKYLDLQGQNNTIYVHGSACFESVLQCWQYGGMLLDNAVALGINMPTDMAAKIVILGAGPSGMLFAHRLKGLGYTDVQIFESTDRYGGKTHTVTQDMPSPYGTHDKTACELGTCYLSPAYDDMAKDLKQFMSGNIRHGFYMDATHDNPQDFNFRGMVTDNQFDGVPVSDKVMPYSKYVSHKGYYEANKPFADPTNWLEGFDETEVEKDIVAKLVLYGALVELLVGENMPMPLKPPQVLLDMGFTSFYDFLEKNELLVLAGLLEYSYSVQGYGPLHKIPAYYGMIWMSVPLIEAVVAISLEKKAGLKEEAVVSVLSKGWLDVWTQMRPTLSVLTNVEVTSIKRC